MSVILEFLKCILCCEDEYIDRTSRQHDYTLIISDNNENNETTPFRNTFSRTRIYDPFSTSVSAPSSSLEESSSITRIAKYPQQNSNSPLPPPLLNSRRNEPTWPSRPSDVTLIPPTPVPSPLKRPPSTPKPPPSSPKPPTPSKTHIRPPKPSPKPSQSSPPSSSSSSSSSPPPFRKQTLSPLPSHISDQEGEGRYRLVDPKDTLPIYMIPEDIEDLIKRDIVPRVLRKPLSPSTYRDYFAALLYAEDYYIEKWSNFELTNVSLELHPASIYQKSGRNKESNARNQMDSKTFVAFKVDSASKERPFLLSRDFVFAKPSGKQVEPFKGIIYRVVKSTTILVEFGKDFHSRHDSTRRYDISFSFNRVCLKRAHQAIAAASAPSFQKFLFPNSVSRSLTPTSAPLHNHKLTQAEKSAVHRTLTCRGPPPFLVKGPLCATYDFSKQLSSTGLVIEDAVLQIYRHHPASKVLVCAPINRTCDVLMRGLKLQIPDSDMFRANAAFREVEGVPTDILPSCLYEKETDCFTCPSLHELKNFRVIFSTFVSSYRLYNAGIPAGHFSYIFLVDASSATEPEAMVALANLADKSTTVVVTGATGNRSSCVRADIARREGLKISYFERLSQFDPYKNGDPIFTAQLAE